MHTDCPPIEYVPAAHGVDALDVVETHREPAGQGVHKDCPPIECAPASQGVDTFDVVEAQA